MTEITRTARTGAEHIRSLRDGRAVYIDGARVDDVTTHPAFARVVASSGLLYDFQARPENVEAMTFVPPGRSARVHRSWQMPRNAAEFVQRRKAMQMWAALSCGFLGRSPDHLASCMIGQLMGLTVFERHGPARAKALAAYVDHARRNDLYLTYVIINPQAERGKDWGQQADGLVARIVDEDTRGITIRGAKMLGTAAVIANKVFVANMQPLKKGEEQLAFSCALPLNTKGIKMLSRKSYEASAESVAESPLSSRFDENDALLYFDDVLVPWERVFVHRDTDMCRAQFHDTPAHILQNHQAQARLAVKLKFLVGLARKITEAIGTTDMPQVRKQLGGLAARAAMVEAMLAGMEANGTQAGEWWLPNKHYLYAAQVMTQDLYPQVMTTLRDLAGGAMIMLPSSPRDWDNPEMAPIIETTQRAAGLTPRQKVDVLKAAWDAVGSEFGSRHTQYEMFYAGARFVTTGHSFRTYDWTAATGMVDALLRGVAD